MSVHRAPWYLLICAILLKTSHVAVAQPRPPQMVRWEIEATVVELADPLGLFPDVRLGDPVTGLLKYDLGNFANPLFSSPPELFLWTNEAWMDTARMTIHNPRSGEDYEFKSTTVDDDELTADVLVLRSFDGELVPEAIDSIFAIQSVVAPAGYQGEEPVVAVDLLGPPGTLPPPSDSFVDVMPPTEINLEDWPTAKLLFYEANLSDPTGTYIEAEIFRLSSAITSALPGDYDYDGDVDQRDYEIWRIEHGDTRLLYADGNGDGIVNLADYVVWRDNLGSVAPSLEPLIQTVPEPAGGVLLGATTMAWFLSVVLASKRLHAM